MESLMDYLESWTSSLREGTVVENTRRDSLWKAVDMQEDLRVAHGRQQA